MKFRSPISGKFVSLAVARRWGYPSEAQRTARLSNIKKAQTANRKRARREPVVERELPSAPSAPSAPPEFEEPSDIDVAAAREMAGELTDDDVDDFFDDAAGDEFEEFDDIDYFDFDEGDEFVDEENDDYEETT